MNYSTMTDDQLFEQLRALSAEVYAAIGTGAVPARNLANEKVAILLDEIVQRPGHIDRFRAMLDDADPRMRYRAALQMKVIDPDAAMRTLRALRSTKGTGIAADALLAIYVMQGLGG
jgi:hypothetical protein